VHVTVRRCKSWCLARSLMVPPDSRPRQHQPNKVAGEKSKPRRVIKEFAASGSDDGSDDGETDRQNKCCHAGQGKETDDNDCYESVAKRGRVRLFGLGLRNIGSIRRNSWQRS